MANCCDITFSIQKDASCKTPTFTDEAIENLRKAFNDNVAHCCEVDFDYTDEQYISANTCTKWNIPTEALQQIARDHDVKIRAVGREDGVGFVQVVCIAQNGEIVQDQEIGYQF